MSAGHDSGRELDRYNIPHGPGQTQVSDRDALSVRAAYEQSATGTELWVGHMSLGWRFISMPVDDQHTGILALSPHSLRLAPGSPEWVRIFNADKNELQCYSYTVRVHRDGGRS